MRSLFLSLLLALTSVAQQPKPIAEIDAGAPVFGVMLSPDGKTVLVATSRTNAALYDLKSGHELHKIEIPEKVNAAAFSPDGVLLAAGTLTGGYKVWNVPSGKIVREETGDGVRVAQIAISPDDRRLVLVQHPEKIRVVEIDTGKSTGPFAPPYGDAFGVAFSADGKTVATADLDTAVHVWDANTGRLVRMFDDSLLAPFAVQYSRDGKLLVKGGAARTLDIVDLASGKVTKSIPVGKFAVRNITLSADTHYAAVQTMNPDDMHVAAPLQVWDIENGRKLAEVVVSPAGSVCFADLGTLLVGDAHGSKAAVAVVPLK